MNALEIAKTKFGHPYIWGAKGPDFFDCSGLVTWAFAASGYLDLRDNCSSGMLWARCMHIMPVSINPGDLAFYGPNGEVSHVMFVAEDGKVYGACGGGPATVKPAPNAYVRYRDSMLYRPDFIGVGRLQTNA